MKKYLLALIVLLAACGAPPEDSDELGQDQQAITVPSGFGFLSQNDGHRYVPATKHLHTNLPVHLTGDCASSLWNDAYTLGRAAYNGNVSGTGFSISNTGGQFDPIVTPRCVPSIAGGLEVSIAGGPAQVVCFAGGFCQYSLITIDVAGDTVVNKCNAAHLTSAQCRAHIADLWQSELNHISGVPDFPVTMAQSSPDWQNMQAYIP